MEGITLFKVSLDVLWKLIHPVAHFPDEHRISVLDPWTLDLIITVDLIDGHTAINEIEMDVIST